MHRETITAEWIKMRSTRSTPLMLALAAAATVGFGYVRSAALAAQWPQTPPSVRAGYDPLAHSLAGVAFAIVILGALGAVAFTSEYATGLIRTTFTATPQRLRVLAAKTAVTGTLALAAGQAMSFAAYYIGRISYSAQHIGPTLSQPGALRAVTCSGLVLAAVAIFGLALGAILRHTAGAITALAAITVVIPGILAGLPQPWNHEIGRFTFITAATQLVKTRPATDLLSPGPSGLVILGYTVGALLLAAVTVSRRDT